MSDFGAFISIVKTDRSAFSDEEVEAMKEICDEIKNRLMLKNSMGEYYYFSVGRTLRVGITECFELNVLLSDYWGDSDMFEWHREVDERDARKITEVLSETLGNGYVLKPAFEWW
ncbi:MAG: hypothetical protein MUC87_09725 [Bacteroidia bacterium]|jgi:hypothetical protein|nr:hypothetical protein [Bacteroidia bacterium]